VKCWRNVGKSCVLTLAVGSVSAPSGGCLVPYIGVGSPVEVAVMELKVPTKLIDNE
jgi:hypothetical protein